MEPLIRVKNMYKIYNPGENEVRALDDVSLEINQGEFIAIVGHSGSGKSTFMNMLGCLDTPDSGEYFLDGKDVANLSDNELSDIRNHKIDSKHIIFRECQSAIHYYNTVLIFKGSNIHSNLL